jgi:sugar phosphate isomerase/epimerase
VRLAFREELAPGDDLVAKVSWISEKGIEGIELAAGSLEMPPAEVRDILDAHGVVAANVGGSFDLLNPDPKVRATAMDVMRQRMELASIVGASAGVLLVPQFNWNPSLNDASPYQTRRELETGLLTAQLTELVEITRAGGSPIFLEPLNRYESHLVNRLADGIAFSEAVGPEIGVMADFFHMSIEEPNIAESIREAGKHIVYVHIADSNRKQPGQGHTDFIPGFAALREIGYDGFLGFECGFTGVFDDAVREAVTSLRETWSSVA